MKRFKQLWQEDKGSAILFVAGSLVLLMGLAAMGTDLAWFYLNTSRIQRAADAAALGGVVWLPNEPTTADNTALSIATQNGYQDGVGNAVVTPAPVPGEPNKLQVTVEDSVPTFFLKVMGFDTMDISRSAVAEYIPPLKLGSPANTFGNNCDPREPGCSGQDNFWANIHGKWTQTSYGDAYSSWCDPGNAFTCSLNPNRRDRGYLYGIESGSPFTVQFIDIAHHNRSGGQTTGDFIRTGDRGCEDGGWGGGATFSADCGATMRITLYAPDPTPLDLSDATVLCTTTITPEPQVDPSDPYVWEAPSTDPCWTQSGTGIYVLEVSHVDPGGQNQRSGLNRYSVRASTGNLYALGDFSIYNNASGTETSFHLAEVPDYYQGKTFVVELFDAGESDDGTLQVVDPSGDVFDDGECRLYERDDPSDPWNLIDTIGAGSDCEEAVTSGEYQRRWLKFEMDIPVSYTCATCWWKMNYVYPGTVNDTTTWRAYMIGNPIHLVG